MCKIHMIQIEEQNGEWREWLGLRCYVRSERMNPF